MPRIIARKEFSYEPAPGTRRRIRRGFAATIPGDHFDAWKRNGLVSAAPDADTPVPDIATVWLHDQDRKMWLTWKGGETPRFDRVGAALSIARWLTVQSAVATLCMVNMLTQPIPA